MTEDLLRRERQLESQMIGLGAARYYERATADITATVGGKQILKSLIAPTSEAIKTWLEEAKAGKASRNLGVAHFVDQFKPDDVAYIVCRLLVSTSAHGELRKLGFTAMLIARTLEDGMQADAFREQHPKVWVRLQKRLEHAPTPGRKAIIFKMATGKVGFKAIKWDHNTRMRVGVTLIELACAATGAFLVETIYTSGRSWNVITAAPETLQALDDRLQRCSLMEPHYMPMVVPPKPWTNPFDGGYYDRGLKLKLVSSPKVSKEYFEELKAAQMPSVYRAINAMQNTPWRINRKVLSVLHEVWDGGATLGGLPQADDQPIPVKPWGEDEPESTDQLNEWKARAARVMDANRKMVSKRFQLQRKLWVAGLYRNEEAIYFPHTLDWRGRVYPVVDALNPQADDTGRALLEFARGMPLGEEGGFWLAVHGANSFGYDKATFQERAEWVVEHQQAIVDSALRPVDGARFWTQADKPWTFLAWCFEWCRMLAHVTNGGQQEDFVSHMPVGMDGSCNGLQNFSAMLRDEVGGTATNLLPQERPADIYQKVADAASAIVDRDAANGEVNAVYWKGKVTRKLAKRPTMTLPYGSGQYGFTDQIVEFLQKHKLDTGTAYIHGDDHLCSRYLAKVMYDSLGTVVVKALEAMKWLKEVSSEVAKEKLPVWWTAPTGMPVCQVYRKVVGRIVDFEILGRRFCMSLAIDSDEIDARKQAQGIAPNFVHSLDAAHMVATVVKCLDAGVQDFAMVHDSYGTHAGNVEHLNRLLREAFVEQYSRPVLQEFVDSVLGRAKQAKLPPPPAVGGLDLEGVKASEYFFA
jgi:DNA-directed RNA polymerase